MRHLKLISISVLSAVLLSACASGKGSFDLDQVEHTPPSSTENKNPPPSYTDDTSQPRRSIEKNNNESIQQAALGYAVAIPRINFLAETPQQEVNITPEQVQAIAYDLNQLPTVFSDAIKKQPKFDSNSDIGIDGIDYSHNGKGLLNQRDFKYIRSGYVIGSNKFDRRPAEKTFYQAGHMGYVFYQGSQPATTLPTQRVSYTGYWDFVSNAVRSRTNLAGGFNLDAGFGVPGNRTGATSLDTEINHRDNQKPLGQSAEFVADFSSKKLTGTLKSNGSTTSSNQKIDTRYTIDANIKGNRFQGTATAEDKNHGIFGHDSQNLEGGFFGANAEELAGKFLANNHSLFAVFGAKRGEISESEMETKFDAIKIDDTQLSKTNMDTFGNAAYLVLNGKQFALIPDGKKTFADMDFVESTKREIDNKTYVATVCCNNLDYVKFGSYAEEATETGNNGSTINLLKNGAYFLVGERTPISEMPTGQVRYQGTWDAKIESQNGPAWSNSAGNQAHSSRSIFDFDFAARSFTGKLIAENGVEDLPTFTLTGTIDKNGFNGTAQTKAGGFQIDAGSTGAGAVVNITADINGAFYGSNAAEIGGTIFKNDGNGDKIGGVFGGKRQVLK